MMKERITHRWRAVLSLLAVLMLVPMVAQAEDETITVYVTEDDGSVGTCEATKLTADVQEIQGYYYVSDTTTLTAPLTVKRPGRLILMDGAQLWALGGIIVESNRVYLTITSGNFTSDIAGTGLLTVTDEYANEPGYDARIGSRVDRVAGHIIINGGTVHTYSTYNGVYSVHGADIGSGHKGGAGNITINGGTVLCEGGHYVGNSMDAATIGSGYESINQTNYITINGGNVTAYGTGDDKCWGAAIGTGQSTSGATIINITGGTVTAYSSTNYTSEGVGIGCGDSYEATDDSEINISGGTVTAYSSGSYDKKAYGAGIGMGEDWSSDYGKVNINITGGTVKGVSGRWLGYGSGIGGGENGGCGTINISGTANVMAYNCEPDNEPYAPGIGDGEDDKGGSVTITGNKCVVDTWGKYGIGNTYSGNFAATATPVKANGKIENGSTHGIASSTDIFSNSWNVLYGTDQWRRISFEYTDSAYYTDENGNVVGPVPVVVYSDGLPDELSDYYYVTGSFEQSSRPTVKNDVIIILADGVEPNFTKGITVEGSNKLTITTGGTTPNFAGTGSLTATGDDDYSGIGSGVTTTAGTININDGSVTATGGNNAAGIGSGVNSSDGTVNINAGTVNINGGSVTATGGNYGAGIGGGYQGDGGIVNISSSKVIAYAGENASAIGGGGYGGNPGTLAIQDNADVIVKSTTSGYYSLYCSPATATPSPDQVVFVRDSVGNNMDGTPSIDQVDLNDIGLGDTHQYAHITLKPKYTCTVTYYPNGGVGEPQIVSYTCGDTATIAECLFTNEDMGLPYWNTEADNSGTSYYPGDSFPIYYDVTLYAQWADSVYYITLEGDTVYTLEYSILTASDTTLTSGNWVVKDNLKFDSRIYMNENNVTLILFDGDTLDATNGGIELLVGGTLTITSGNSTKHVEGTGYLDAVGGYEQAGIGGSRGEACGDVNIRSCRVHAYGGDSNSDHDETTSAIGAGVNGFSLIWGLLKVYGGADVVLENYGIFDPILRNMKGMLIPPEDHYVYVQLEDGTNICNDSVFTPSIAPINVYDVGLYTSSFHKVHIFFKPLNKIDNVYYTQADGTVSTDSVQPYDCHNYLPETLGDGSNTTFYYYVSGDFDIDSRVTVNGHAVIILADDSQVRANRGITVNEGNSLLITTGGTTPEIKGNGYLFATSSIVVESDFAINAGIGSTYNHNAGSITINDGIVEAYCTYAPTTGYGAGIGGGRCKHSYLWVPDGGMGGDIVINGGTVSAYCTNGGTDYGVGIGGGYYSDAYGDDYEGTITINGNRATVVARGASAMFGKTITATAIDDGQAVCAYGDTVINTTEVTGTTLDLLTNPNVNSVAYAKVYFTGNHRKGDVNHDGVIDIIDVTALIDFVLSDQSDTTNCCKICADVNDDGVVDIIDVTALIDLVLGASN